MDLRACWHAIRIILKQRNWLGQTLIEDEDFTAAKSLYQKVLML